MKKKIILFLVLSCVFSVITGCSGKENTAPDYSIVVDNARNSERYMRITTDATSKDDLKKIVEDMQDKIDNPDAVWVEIHGTDEKPLGKHKASARFANSSKGVIMTGVEDEESFIIQY